MTNEQAIAKLKALHADVRQVEPEVYCAHEDDAMMLYRLNDGTLERRVDYDEYTCGWEAVE